MKIRIFTQADRPYVVGKAPERVAAFSSSGVHPTSYLRPLISTELVRRIGFAKHADAFDRAWLSLYPGEVANRLPAPLRESFPLAVKETVAALCFQPIREAGVVVHPRSVAGASPRPRTLAATT